MIKKILVFVFLFFSFLSFSYWEEVSETQSALNEAQESLNQISETLNETQEAYNMAEIDRTNSYDMMDWQESYHDTNVQNTRDAYNQAQQDYNEAQDTFNKAREADCAVSWDCLDQATFMIKTSLFAPGWKDIKEDWVTAQQNINSALWTIIEKLMIAFWILALLIMTVWAWYIIMYHGQDELLSKWKSIFTSGIIALVVALTSYYLVSLVRYILYFWT